MARAGPVEVDGVAPGQFVGAREQPERPFDLVGFTALQEIGVAGDRRERGGGLVRERRRPRVRRREGRQSADFDEMRERLLRQPFASLRPQELDDLADDALARRLAVDADHQQPLCGQSRGQGRTDARAQPRRVVRTDPATADRPFEQRRRIVAEDDQRQPGLADEIGEIGVGEVAGDNDAAAARGAQNLRAGSPGWRRGDAAPCR